MKKEVITYRDPKSPISEIFKTLRTNIQFINANDNSKTILLTSIFSGEGKSWISANLAVTFAQANKKILLIDADMRKGRQYNIWGISPKPGLSNYLSGIGINGEIEYTKNLVNYIQETEVENLYVMTSGNIPPNPSELLVSAKMVNLLEEVKTMWDVIIIETAPSMLVTDSLILARIVDSTIIVTACNKTKKEYLKRVISNIRNVDGKIAGIVLNKIPISSKKYNQSYYYSSTTIQKINSPNFYKKSDYLKIKMNDTINNLKNLDNSNNYENSKELRNFSHIGDLKTNQAESQSSQDNIIGNIEIENQNDISLEKTNAILKEITDYIDKEKKKL